MYSVYGIYNKITGKLYIGITNNLKRRWSEHRKNSKTITKKSYAIHRAIAKYGYENFIFKCIEEVANLSMANSKETEWINILKENNYELYNETNGGDGTPGYSRKWTEEQRHQASLKKYGSKNPMYGIKLLGKSNGNYGKPMKDHVKQALLKCRRKLSEDQVEKIIILFNTGEYTQTQLAKDFGVSLTQIHRIIKGKSWVKK